MSSGHPTPEEQNKANQLIYRHAAFRKSTVIKSQADVDDGEMDGLLENTEELEARRKGFPNHKGEVLNPEMLERGWESDCVKKGTKRFPPGLMINERTLRKHTTNGLTLILEFNSEKFQRECPRFYKEENFAPRYAVITPEQVKELLDQPHRTQRSQNSGSIQSVKFVPLDWFKKYE